MKIGDGQFTDLTSVFSMYYGSIDIKGTSELDLLDYHWFLVSILDGIEKQYTLELMDNNNDYKTHEYKIIKGEINDEKLNEVTLTLKRIEDNIISEHLFEIEKVEDARAQRTMKYYVKTKDGNYRFNILGLS